MNQDKGRGVVIMEKSKYQDKCLMILENDNFKTLDHDPTKKTEEKIQQILRKMKNRLSPQEYFRLYQVVLVPASSMEQLKCTNNLKMTQSMNFQYGQLFPTLELTHTICESV